MDSLISIVIPIYNEANNLAQEYNIIKKVMDGSNYPYEIIVVNDGSTDDSLKIVSGLKHVRLIDLKKRKGNGYARRIGTMAALGDIIAWSDCDLSYPNYIIPEMIKAMIEKNYDQIIGARNCETGNLKYLRYLVKWIIKKIASALTSTDIQDLNSGLRLFKKESGTRYFHLLPNGFSCMATMTLAFICDGLSIGYFPINYLKRRGKSKFHPVWDTIKYFIQVIKVIIYFKKGRLN